MQEEDAGLAELEPSLLERIHHNEEDEKVAFDHNHKLLDKLAKLEKSLMKFERQKSIKHEQEISYAIQEKRAKEQEAREKTMTKAEILAEQFMYYKPK